MGLHGLEYGYLYLIFTFSLMLLWYYKTIFVEYFTMLSVSEYTVSDGRMFDDELERIWKCSWSTPGTISVFSWEVMRKIIAKTADFLTKIRNGNLPNTDLNCHVYTNLDVEMIFANVEFTIENSIRHAGLLTCLLPVVFFLLLLFGL
jgi:hypothetical protein